MNNADFEKFKEGCQQLPYLVDEQKEAAEQFLCGYLSNPSNFEAIRLILENEPNAQVKLVTIETLNKAIMATARENSEYSSIRDEIGMSHHSKEIGLEEEMTKYYLNVVQYLLSFIKNNYKSNPKFITNSIANVVATYLEVQVYNLMPVESLTQYIIGQFFEANATPDDFSIGLKVFYFAINNITISATNYNFFKYRKMLTAFQNGFLYEAFNATRSAIKLISTEINGSNVEQTMLDLLTLALGVYFKCLTYPFSISFFDFKEDMNLEEITIILFPEAYAQGLSDFEFYDMLFRLLELKVSREVSLEITRIMSRCAASRTSIMPDDTTKLAFKQKMVEGFIQLTYTCPLDDEAFVSEIIECVLRIMFVSGSFSMISQPAIKDSFDKAATMLSTSIVQLSPRLDSKLMQQLIEFWKKLKPHKETFNSTEKIIQFLNYYFEYNFIQRTSGTFFTENIKSYKKLKDLVEQAFENLRDLMTAQIDASCKIIAYICDALVKQFQLVINSNMSNELFANRLGHFILLFTQTFLKTDSFHSYTISIQDTVENEYFDTAAKVSSQIFELVANYRNYIANIEDPSYRGYVLSTLYFFETFTTLVISTQTYSTELDLLIVDDELFKRLAETYNMSSSFEDFFDKVTTSITENLAYHSFTVSKASLHVVRTMTDKLKRVFHGKKKDKGVFDKLCNKLIADSNVHLVDPKNLKLRTYLYEIIGICYLDEKYSDYIENCHLILKQILDNNTDRNGQIDLKRVFYDLYGIYKSISYTKVISVFTKICYPKIQDLLARFGSNNLSDSTFVVLLIDFYAHLFERTAQNYQVTQSQTVTFKIISDACRMISMLLSEVNGAIEKVTSPDALLEFMTSNIKLVKKFLIAFDSLLKNTDISFSVFHFFGNQEFLTFSRNIFKFLYLVSECLISHFPDKQPLFYGVLKEGLKCLSDYIIEYFEVDDINNLFKLIHVIFNKRASEMINEAQQKQNIDDTVIDDVSAMAKALLVSLYEEYKIYPDNYEYQVKIKSIISANGPIALDLSLKVVELAQMVGSTIRQTMALSDIIFYFIVVFQETGILDSLIRQTLNEDNPAYMDPEVQMALQLITTKLRFSLDENNKEDFSKNFNVVVKHLIEKQKIGTQKQSSFMYNID